MDVQTIQYVFTLDNASSVSSGSAGPAASEEVFDVRLERRCGLIEAWKRTQ